MAFQGWIPPEILKTDNKTNYSAEGKTCVNLGNEKKKTVMKDVLKTNKQKISLGSSDVVFLCLH